MTYLNTLKNFLFLGPFLLCHFVSRGNEFFSAASSPYFGVSCTFVVTSWKQKEVWRTLLSPAPLFSLFMLVFCQAPISMMDFGILLTSTPEDIALPWHWITMLPLLATQPLSQGSTLGTATILEVGCFREMQDRFSWCRSSGAHHWCLPRCTLFAAKSKCCNDWF